ncbi:hypothetical protein G3N57_35755 [Paraburkholderia sp. Se-20369]|nr:hypothetical protein [Paraburkholderia sp. Se-20369]
MTGEVPAAATSCTAAVPADASGAAPDGGCAGVGWAELKEEDDVPAEPAEEGVFSLMTMVWCVAHAGGWMKIHYASVHDRAANQQHPVNIVAGARSIRRRITAAALRRDTGRQ